MSGREQEESPADVARDDESIRNLEHGGLPVTALERIRESEAKGGAWTSDLSVAELGHVRRWGFEPAGLVMGTSVYHLGSQWGRSFSGSSGGGFTSRYPCPHGFDGYGYGGGRIGGIAGGGVIGVGGIAGGNEHRPGFNWEHVVHEQGMVEARNTAMSRMVEEATGLGAHGVVGVRLTFQPMEGVGSAVEFSAVGTAIRRHGAPALAVPFTSHLSGQDFAKLMAGGYIPAALVMGICAMEVDPGCGMEWRMASWGNTELNQYTDAAQVCREIAVKHMESEVLHFNADGAVGVEVSYEMHELMGESKLFQFLCLGTAVRRYAQTPLPEPPLTMMRLGGR